MVGGMGHTSSVALGYSLSSKKKTVCIDGDGSFLMHLGAIKTAGTFANKNFKYILLNNNSHDSVGGQNTYSNDINFEKLSKSLGFKKFYSIYLSLLFINVNLRSKFTIIVSMSPPAKSVVQTALHLAACLTIH